MCDFLLIHTFGKCVQVPLSLFIYMKKLNNSQQLLFITNMISPVFVLAKIEKKMSRLSYHLRSQNTSFKRGGRK